MILYIYIYIHVFHQWGINGGSPIAEWFVLVNPQSQMDDLGVALLSETSMYHKSTVRWSDPHQPIFYLRHTQTLYLAFYLTYLLRVHLAFYLILDPSFDGKFRWCGSQLLRSLES